MKTVLRFAVIAAALLAAIGASAQRDIVLKLNKHNFIGGDTLNVTAEFKGFESDPIVSDVYADIVDSNDSIVASAVMHRLPDGRYTTTVPFPGHGLKTHQDLPNVCSAISFRGNHIFGDGAPVVLRINGFLASPVFIAVNPFQYSKFGTYGFGDERAGDIVEYSASSYITFKYIPIERITSISISRQPIQRSYHMSQWDIDRDRAKFRFMIDIKTADGDSNDLCSLHVTGLTASDEIVACVEPIKLQRIFLNGTDIFNK